MHIFHFLLRKLSYLVYAQDAGFGDPGTGPHGSAMLLTPADGKLFPAGAVRLSVSRWYVQKRRAAGGIDLPNSTATQTSSLENSNQRL